MQIDLERRSFPNTARPLLSLAALRSGISSAVDIHFFTSARNTAAAGPHIHRQSGRDFATRFENAIERIAEMGYEEVVAVGRDCPGMRAVDVDRAFVELATRKLVLGPDHRGGCYLIAFRSADRELLREVRWKQNTDCAQLRQRCGEKHVHLLPVKHDLDSWADLRIFARSDDPLARLAMFLLGVICTARRRLVHFVSIASQQMRVRQQMPPPAFAA
jgi:2-phospho-L-lactate guanylyltransferase (CobY/MobA/RfbA family)